MIFSDHGNGTRALDPPVYRSGVLCLDGVEIRTLNGHYVAIGMRPAPYPLGGEARDVVEDVRRLGGFGVAAHPGSERQTLQWTDWSSPVDGVEWLNADSEWRDENPMRLTRALLDYPFRPVETLAAMLDRPQQVLARWDRLTSTGRWSAWPRPTRMRASGSGDPTWYEDVVLARVPSYDVAFRTFSNHVLMPRP